MARGQVADDALTRSVLRARLALLRQRTALSADRGVAVTGPQADANALLLEAVQQHRAALAHLLGLPVPLEGQQLRLQVLPPPAAGVQVLDPGTLLRMEWLGGIRVYRILLPDYESAHLVAAREAVVDALLAACLSAGTAFGEVPRLPAWFRQGVQHVLYPRDVEETLLAVEQLWRHGEVPSLQRLLARHPAGQLSEQESLMAGAVVYWLATRASHPELIPALLAQFATGEGVEMAWLQRQLGGDPEDAWDRWMLRQRRIIRSVGVVRQAHIEQLRSVLLLSPGQHGIPLRAGIPVGGALHQLAAYHAEDWLGTVLRQKRRALEVLAQGRPVRFQEIVQAFVAILDGVASGQAMITLAEQEDLAYISLALLARDVMDGGGVWQPPE